jgi:hypothetical protein
MQLVIEGKLNKQIAAQLGASAKTIKVHRGHLMSKMRVRSVAQLVSLDLMVRSRTSGLPALLEAASEALRLGRMRRDTVPPCPVVESRPRKKIEPRKHARALVPSLQNIQ